MAEPTVVQSIADNRIVATSERGATATERHAVAHETIATNLQKMVELDYTPYADHAVWMMAAAARSQHPDKVTASSPEVAVYADKILAAYKQRFPRPAPAPTPAT